jgi:predicted DNA-binding transcriptional regulator
MTKKSPAAMKNASDHIYAFMKERGPTTLTELQRGCPEASRLSGTAVGVLLRFGLLKKEPAKASLKEENKHLREMVEEMLRERAAKAAE